MQSSVQHAPDRAIAANLARVYARIRSAEQRHGRRNGEVQLLAVSKTRPVEDVRAAVAAGQLAFGENQLQDAVPKIEALADAAVAWHFIGPVQSNKSRPIAEHFDWVHSIDRLKIARRLAEQRPPGRPALQVCAQLNVSAEPSKAGVPREQLQALCEGIASLPGLRLRGIMAIPAPSDDLDTQRRAFAEVRAAFQQLQDAGLTLDTLSMGMSDDLEAAIAEGATIVRVGTAIFGARPRTTPHPT